MATTKLRWYQFTLRGLFVFTLLVSVALSWFATRLQQARAVRARVRAIQELDPEAKVYFENTPKCGILRSLFGDEFFGDVRSITVERFRWNEEGPADTFKSSEERLRCIAECRALKSLSLEGGSVVTDAALKCVEPLTGLDCLCLRGLKITDAGLEHLAGLTNLRWLDISGVPITGMGLSHLKGLTKLETVILCNTQLEDRALEYLKDMRGLRQMDLRDTKIVGDGCRFFEGLTKLADLELNGAPIDDTALEHLGRAKKP